MFADEVNGGIDDNAGHPGVKVVRLPQCPQRIEPLIGRLTNDVQSIMLIFYIRIGNDDIPVYLRFLEDVFPYMENYHYYLGMELVLDTLSALMKDVAVSSVSDRALLLSYQAAYEKKADKAIKMQKDAIAMIPEVTADNALLVSNLYANLGGMYRVNGKLELAKESMEQAIRIIDEYGLAYYHDSVVQITNYAVLLTDMGHPNVGLSALRKLCRVIREYNSDTGLDYANVQEAMGGICLTMGEIQQATAHFQKAMKIYETVFEFEPDTRLVLLEKCWVVNHHRNIHCLE